MEANLNPVPIESDSWFSVSLVAGRVRIEIDQAELDDLIQAIYNEKCDQEEIIRHMESDRSIRMIMGDDMGPYKRGAERMEALYEALLSVRYK